MDINYSNMGILANESASFLGIVTDDVYLAMESDWASYERHRDGKNESFSASIGKNTISGTKNESDSVGSKFLYHLKRIFASIITSVVKAFQWIVNALRNILQVILIPVNAALKIAGKKPALIISSDEKIVYEKLKRAADQKCQRKLRDLFNEESKFIDKAFDVCEDISKLTSKALAGGDNFHMSDSDRSKYNSVDGLAEKLATENEARYDKLNQQIEEVNSAREEILKEAQSKIKNAAVVDDILAASVCTVTEQARLIQKANEMQRMATEHVDSCTKILDRVKNNSFTAVSKDLNDISSTYMKMSKVTVQFTKDFIMICNGEKLKKASK